MHTIDQHQLVGLLLQGAISAIATARGGAGAGMSYSNAIR